ncbi:hypothetical protein LTS18_007470 [Coniosporium uncinatum]|uniref:Uncharacterized protein n=1 Tax=Coniosporium uncinatum TaxID=93489 RepID=A0ACC3DP92_9PEZI|nr:hypothetical protein LTS18_007470 [Coniosporium uncinatum]
MTVTAGSDAKNGTSVQLYTDICDKWTYQNRSTTITQLLSGPTAFFKLDADNAATFVESSAEQAPWADVIYATQPSNASSIPTSSGPRNGVRGSFYSNGTLSGLKHECEPRCVAAFAYDLGHLTGENATLQVAVGVVRNDTVNYLGTSQTHYYRAKRPDTADAIRYFFDDYPAAPAESQSLDANISTIATSVAGQNYSDILTLSVRQILGAMNLTVPSNSTDNDDPSAFLKEISSNGNMQTINVIFPMLPYLYALAAKYTKILLEPVLSYVASGRWPLPFFIHGMGTYYSSTILIEGIGVFTSKVTGDPYFDVMYGNATWYMLFNIFPDVLLNLRVFNNSTYEAQSEFHPTVRAEAGVPIDGAVRWDRTDWQMWSAASNTSQATSNMFVNDLHALISNGKNKMPFTDRYWASEPDVGKGVFRARPTVAAHFALWAMAKTRGEIE